MGLLTLNGLSKRPPSAIVRPAPQLIDWQRFLKPSTVAADPELAIVTTFFNPCRYRRPVENWHLFSQQMAAQGLPLFTIELSFDGTYELPDGERMERVTSSSILWHKERLINLMVSKLPARFSKIAWIDCDIFWLNPDWHVEAVKVLDRKPVVQLFADIAWTTATSFMEASRPGVARKSDGRPGGAWLAHRDHWSLYGGLYDLQIVGGGDSVAWYAYSGQFNAPYLNRLPYLKRDVQPWMERVHRLVRGDMGYVPELAIHRWHGSKDDRQYWSREALMAVCDPRRDLTDNADGCLEWSPDAHPDLVEGVKAYFMNRREDGGLEALSQPSTRS